MKIDRISSVEVTGNKERNQNIYSSDLTDLLEQRYATHYRRINHSSMNKSAYLSSCQYIEEDIVPLLPGDVNSKLVEIGIESGYLIVID